MNINNVEMQSNYGMIRSVIMHWAMMLETLQNNLSAGLAKLALLDCSGIPAKCVRDSHKSASTHSTCNSPQFAGIIFPDGG